MKGELVGETIYVSNDDGKRLLKLAYVGKYTSDLSNNQIDYSKDYSMDDLLECSFQYFVKHAGVDECGEYEFLPYGTATSLNGKDVVSAIADVITKKYNLDPSDKLVFLIGYHK